MFKLLVILIIVKPRKKKEISILTNKKTEPETSKYERKMQIWLIKSNLLTKRGTLLKRKGRLKPYPLGL